MKHIWEIDRKLQMLDVCRTLIEAYFKYEGAGGVLHVVIDDGNLEDHFVKHCLEEAEKEGCIYGQMIAKLLLTFTVEERDKLTSEWWEIYDEIENQLRK